jgi:hypothetical protein
MASIVTSIARGLRRPGRLLLCLVPLLMGAAKAQAEDGYVSAYATGTRLNIVTVDTSSTAPFVVGSFGERNIATLNVPNATDSNLTFIQQGVDNSLDGSIAGHGDATTDVTQIGWRNKIKMRGRNKTFRVYYTQTETGSVGQPPRGNHWSEARVGDTYVTAYTNGKFGLVDIHDGSVNCAYMGRGH